MSLKTRLDALAARFAALGVNPILVKELRQLVRSRFVCVGLVVYALLLFAVAAVALLAQTADEPPDAVLLLGETTAKAVFYPLFFAVVAAVPVYVGLRFTLERDPKRIDLQYTTDLTPRQIIDGKHASAMALAAMLAGVAFPFLVMSYLLRGMDLAGMLVSVGLMCAASFTLSWFAVAIAAQPLSKAFRIILLGSMVPPTFGLAAAAIELPGEISWDNPGEIWTAVVLVAGFTAIGILLARSHAIAVLSPRGSNRDRGFRKTVLASSLAWAGLVVFGTYRLRVAYHAFDFSVLRAGWSLPMLAIGFGLLLTHCGSDLAATRRTLAERSGRRLARALQYPFFTGATNGIVFSVLFLAATLAAHFALILPESSPFRVLDENKPLFLAAVEAVSATLVVRALWRRFLRRRMPAKFVPALVGAVYLAANALPPLLTIGSQSNDFDILCAIPLNLSIFLAQLDSYLFGLSRDVYLPLHCAYAFILATAAVLLNARALRASWRQHMDG